MVQIGNFHIGSAHTAKPPVLTAGEAYLIWDHLISRYDTIIQTLFYQAFIHDPELEVILIEGLAMVLEKQTERLEKELQIYKMPLPQKPPKSINFNVDSNIFADRFIFKRVYSGIQKFLDNHVRAFRIMVVNDPLGRLFMKYSLEEIKAFDRLCNYGKIKGWIDVPPLMGQQGITSGEAFLLWDNLVARYDLKEFLNIFQNFVHDFDFKNMLVDAVDGVLSKQIIILERVIDNYNLSMPQRPQERPHFAGSSAAITDSYIFRRYFTMIQDFLDLCARSIQVAVTDDSLRKMYIDFYGKKIDTFDEACVYGKMKGWFEVAPFMNPQ